NTPYLLLDSGDFSDGTWEANSTKGALSIDFMNKLHYDAATIGNHEGTFGPSAMLKNISNANFAILAANLKDTKTQTYPEGVIPFKTFVKGGKKIAVIGLARRPQPSTKRMITTKDKTAIKKAVEELSKQNPDAIVVLAHESIKGNGKEKETNLYKKIQGIKGINLVLGGHEHKIIQNKKVGGVVFVESGEKLKGVSKIALDFDDKTGELKNMKSVYIPLDIAKTGRNLDILAFAASNQNKTLDKTISSLKQDIPRYNPKNAEGEIDSPLANLFADILKNYAKADIGVQNTWGQRADLKKGPIKRRDIYNIFPFTDGILVMEVDGKFIHKLVLKALNARTNNSAFNYSGLTVKYRLKNDEPQIVEIKVNGEPLENSRKYSLVVNDYIGKGNSEGYLFKKVKNKKAFGNKNIEEIFTDYFIKHPNGVPAPKNGRIKRVD
ncbi:MAG: bifunctional metallophosphatase/5'-nucleotidase, partial [Elusimicrobiota bacterium]|nr:bifunctional metallophosphatase/5'-nucleotidase [Elusimicrobiota bacterium]